MSKESIEKMHEKVTIASPLRLGPVYLANDNKEQGAQCGSQEGFEKLQKEESMNKYIPIWLRASRMEVLPALAVLAVVFYPGEF